MNETPSTTDILARRPPKLPVDPWRPHAVLSEPERQPDGTVADVLTVFLVNRECPFHCLMCDLWRHTLDEAVPLGAIPAQLDAALRQFPPPPHIKLYNSGSFFDPQAIPTADYSAIARRLPSFRTVIVESHPRFLGDRCLRFRELIPGRLEVAIGLETVHPKVLPRLNKQMTLADYQRSVEFLLRHGIAVRTFVLLRPPYLDEAAGIEWACRSVQFAAGLGVECCVVIPTRGGNGILDDLSQRQLFSPPQLRSLEIVCDRLIADRRGRVLVDLWDVERLAACAACRAARLRRLQRMNLTQVATSPVFCPHCADPDSPGS